MDRSEQARPIAANYFTTGVSGAGQGAIVVFACRSILAFLGLPQPPAMLTAAYTLVIGFLMVSRLPVFSGKMVRMAGAAGEWCCRSSSRSCSLLSRLLIGYPLAQSFRAGTVLYLLSLPLGWKS